LAVSFQLHPWILGWLRIRFHDLFCMFSIKLSWSHDLSHGFGRLIQLTWVFLSFSNWFFFQFHPLTLSWLRIRFRDLFWFAFYNVILILWFESRVLWVNSSRLESFYCIMFLDWFFFSSLSFSNEFIENWAS